MNKDSDFMPVECLNLPKVLFYDEQYKALSADAKLLYALLLDRKEMAFRNGWVDKHGCTYVIYPRQEMMRHLNASRYRVDQALEELEAHDRMVEVTLPYPGKPCQIYVKDITDKTEENEMKRMKEGNTEMNNSDQAACGATRFFTTPCRAVRKPYDAVVKFQKKDWDEIMEIIGLGGHVVAKPVISEEPDEFSDDYKDDSYYCLSPKERKIVDMQQRGYIDKHGQVNEDSINDDACEFAGELSLIMRTLYDDPVDDAEKLLKYLDNLWSDGKYAQLKAVLRGFALLFHLPEKYLENMDCCRGEAKTSYLASVIAFTENELLMAEEEQE